MYSIKIATYDNKLGPRDLTAIKKGDFCRFIGRSCPGFNCILITDAINSKEKNIFFADEDTFYQSAKIKVTNPEKRGGVERFVVLFKIRKGRGLIRDSIINDFREDFKNEYRKQINDVEKIDFKNLKNQWETKLNRSVSLTNEEDLSAAIRDKLNIISLSLQMVKKTNPEIGEKEENLLGEALVNIYEIDKLLNKDTKNAN